MWARIIVLPVSFEFEVENWRLTRRDLLHQHFPTLPVRFLKLKTSLCVLLYVFFFS